MEKNSIPDGARGVLPPNSPEILAQQSGLTLERVNQILSTGKNLDELSDAIVHNTGRNAEEIRAQITLAHENFRNTVEAKQGFFKDTWVGRRMVDVKNFAWNNKGKLALLLLGYLGYNYLGGSVGKIKNWGVGKLDGAKPLHRFTAWALLVIFGLPVVFALMRVLQAFAS